MHDQPNGSNRSGYAVRFHVAQPQVFHRKGRARGDEVMMVRILNVLAAIWKHQAEAGQASGTCIPASHCLLLVSYSFALDRVLLA